MEEEKKDWLDFKLPDYLLEMIEKNNLHEPTEIQ